MEIERKYLIDNIPSHIYDHPYKDLEQGYLCMDPVIRIRKEEDEYFLTYKSKGLLAREEHNLPLTEESYLHLKEKVDGAMITKRRYYIPMENHLTMELDIFKEALHPLVTVEVEFATIEEANAFVPPSWFGKDVTFDPKYKNNYLATLSYGNFLP
ncbi:MAG TPA: CYTH domain-containing protein [Candidatus Merdenecus merdavium]|nr:CYTH domain-containing protein [Candidatus Merdenecus merdavium]